jgi:hypothetical protein
VQCESVVTAQFESPLGVGSKPYGIKHKDPPPWSILHKQDPGLNLRVECDPSRLGASQRIPLGYCKLVTLVTPLKTVQHQTQEMSRLCKQLWSMVTSARTNLSSDKNWELEDLITEFYDIFATKSSDYGQTNWVYHCIDSGDARLSDSPRRDPLWPTKQRWAMILKENCGLFQKEVWYLSQLCHQRE